MGLRINGFLAGGLGEVGPSSPTAPPRSALCPTGKGQATRFLLVTSCAFD